MDLQEQDYSQTLSLNHSQHSEEALHNKEKPKTSVHFHQKEKKDSYLKNISSYIANTILKNFLSYRFRPLIASHCKKREINLDKMMDYFHPYLSRFKGVTHLKPVILEKRDDTEEVKGFKLLFQTFWVFFLREEELRCLIKNQKKTKKELYVGMKNKLLFMFGREVSEAGEEFREWVRDEKERKKRR